jgi:hypothetical protein
VFDLFLKAFFHSLFGANGGVIYRCLWGSTWATHHNIENQNYMFPGVWKKRFLIENQPMPNILQSWVFKDVLTMLLLVQAP